MSKQAAQTLAANQAYAYPPIALQLRVAVSNLVRMWSIEITSIVGEDAKAAGLGGIYNVGRASTVPPRLVILKWTPSDPVAAVSVLYKCTSLPLLCLVVETFGTPVHASVTLRA